SAQLLEFPVDPYTMTAGKNETRLDGLFQQVRAFQPELLVLASYQWTLAEEQLTAALSDVPVAGMTGQLCQGTGRVSVIRFTRQVEVPRELHEHCGGFALLHQFDRTASPPFQFGCCPFGPHTFILLAHVAYGVFRKVGRSSLLNLPSLE